MQSSANPDGVKRGRDSLVLAITDMRKRRSDGRTTFEVGIPKFSVSQREFIAVVGASGCGKSTLLDMLGLILRPDGAARFDIVAPGGKIINLLGRSRRVAATMRRKHIGYVLQTGGLLDFLSLKQNIALPLSMVTGVKQKSQLVKDIAEKLGILGQLNKRPHRVSGGERQRAAIARALIHDPAVILADEPTAALDPERATDLVRTFRKLSEERGSSIVMVTHNHELVKGVADRVYTFDVRQVTKNKVVSTCRETTFDALGNTRANLEIR